MLRMTTDTRRMFSDHWANVVVFASAIVLACSAALLRAYSTNPDEQVTAQAKWIAIAGGFLAGVFALALQVQYYGWEHPWLSIALSVPVGYGSPLVLAWAVVWLDRLTRRFKNGD